MGAGAGRLQPDAGNQLWRSHSIVGIDSFKKSRNDQMSYPQVALFDRKNVTVTQTIPVDACSSKTICLYNLKGRCAYANNCDAVHSDLPYQWLYKQRYDDDWSFVNGEQNVDIEKAFCDASKQKHVLTLGTTILEVNFNDMTAVEQRSSSGKGYDVHRLSTNSSIVTQQPLSTSWVWYWKTPDSDQWKEYGESYHQYTASIKSPQIEQAYLDNPYGSVKFATHEFDYILDFRKMAQQNTKVSTTRAVMRRPKFISKQDVLNLKKQIGAGKQNPVLTSRPSSGTKADIIPKHWRVRPNEFFLNHFELVELSNTSGNYAEFCEIKGFFLQTMTDPVTVTSIKRIQNGDLWENYVNERSRMSKKSSTNDPSEMRLFHGTRSDFVDAICRQGCDFRLSGKTTGTRFGKGSYFAKTSAFSHDYTSQGNNQMFVVKVLVGEYVYGRPDYVRPPPKHPSDPLSELFDSCVDDSQSPRIFVVFDNRQVYPEYLIQYQ